MSTLRFVRAIKQSRFRNPRGTTQPLGHPDRRLLCLSYRLHPFAPLSRRERGFCDTLPKVSVYSWKVESESYL